MLSKMTSKFKASDAKADTHVTMGDIVDDREDSDGSMQRMEDDTRDAEAINEEVDDSVMQDIHKLAAIYAKRKGFAQYLQTSSLLGSNVKNVFDEAIQHTLNHRKDRLAALNIQEGPKNRNKNSLEEKAKKGKCSIF